MGLMSVGGGSGIDFVMVYGNDMDSTPEATLLYFKNGKLADNLTIGYTLASSGYYPFHGVKIIYTNGSNVPGVTGAQWLVCADSACYAYIGSVKTSFSAGDHIQAWKYTSGNALVVFV